MPLVHEVMNPNLLYLRVGNRVELALQPILDSGLTAVPVLDDDHRPIGIVSVHDIASGARGHRPSAEKMKTIVATAILEDAARILADENLHHLIVIDDRGVAVGMLSSLDVVRGLLSLPPRHPRTPQSYAIGDEDETDR